MAAGAASSQNPSTIQRYPVRPTGGRPDPGPGAKARRHRMELLNTMASFERVLNVPAADPTWRGEVGALLSGLREAFSEHVAVTEGPNGLYGELLDHAPRLARGIEGLQREHAALLARMERLSGKMHRREEPGIEQIRGWADELLHELSLHRQRGADLVYEAYATDIGGET